VLHTPPTPHLPTTQHYHKTHRPPWGGRGLEEQQVDRHRFASSRTQCQVKKKTGAQPDLHNISAHLHIKSQSPPPPHNTTTHPSPSPGTKVRLPITISFIKSQSIQHIINNIIKSPHPQTHHHHTPPSHITTFTHHISITSTPIKSKPSIITSHIPTINKIIHNTYIKILITKHHHHHHTSTSHQLITQITITNHPSINQLHPLTKKTTTNTTHTQSHHHITTHTHHNNPHHIIKSPSSPPLPHTLTTLIHPTHIQPHNTHINTTLTSTHPPQHHINSHTPINHTHIIIQWQEPHIPPPPLSTIITNHSIQHQILVPLHQAIRRDQQGCSAKDYTITSIMHHFHHQPHQKVTAADRRSSLQSYQSSSHTHNKSASSSHQTSIKHIIIQHPFNTFNIKSSTPSSNPSQFKLQHHHHHHHLAKSSSNTSHLASRHFTATHNISTPNLTTIHHRTISSPNKTKPPNIQTGQSLNTVGSINPPNQSTHPITHSRLDHPSSTTPPHTSSTPPLTLITNIYTFNHSHISTNN